jgi:hypothetical protein
MRKRVRAMTNTDLFAGAWRKSSRSGHGGNCVELNVLWQKSSRSGNGGNCVEVAHLTKESTGA